MSLMVVRWFKWRSMNMTMWHSFNGSIFKSLSLSGDSVSSKGLLLTRGWNTNFCDSITILTTVRLILSWGLLTCCCLLFNSLKRISFRSSNSNRLVEIFRNIFLLAIHSSMSFSKFLNSSQIVSDFSCLLYDSVVLLRAFASNTALFAASAWNLIL